MPSTMHSATPSAFFSSDLGLGEEGRLRHGPLVGGEEQHVRAGAVHLVGLASNILKKGEAVLSSWFDFW